MAAIVILLSGALFAGALGKRAVGGDFRGRVPIHAALFGAGKLGMGALWLLALIRAARSLTTRGGPLQAAGAGLFGLGTALALAAFAALGRDNRLGLGEVRLKTSGVYAWSRHPMYAGFDLMALGGSLYAPRPVSLILLPLAVGVHHLVILAEERSLKRQHPQAWQDYAASVRRYLGRK